MAITRQLGNGNKLTDWTDEVNDIANQYGLLNGRGLFNTQGVATESVIFDKQTNTTTLIPRTSRRAPEASRGKDRKVETFSLSLPYFEHKDYITPQDIQGHRMPNTPDSPETLGNVIMTKLEDMRMAADQTREYMKSQALKGLVAAPDGVMYNMFQEFGITQDTINFELDNANTIVRNKTAQLKRLVSSKALAGRAIGRIEVMVSPQFFDKLRTHPSVREEFLHYQETNQRRDAIRGVLQTFERWGVVDTFEYDGVLFWSYDARFNIDDGSGSVSETKIFNDDPTVEGGYTIIDGMGKDAYRGYYAPENVLDGVNRVGAAEMYVRQYTDPRGKFHEMELEMSSMYLLMKPQLSVKVVG